MKQQVFLKTLGCQMNVRDSEIVRGMLEEKGYKFTENEMDADIIIFNTCSVREHAEHKAVSWMGQMIMKKAPGAKGSAGVPLSAGRHRPGRIYGIIGCVAQHKKEELFRNLSGLDFIAGPSEVYEIPGILEKVKSQRLKVKTKNEELKLKDERRLVNVSTRARPLDNIDPEYRDSKTHAFVNITYGCNNYCSYCIVPYVRGPEVSRPVEDIIKEIESLVARGIKEVTLLGQNVNSYMATTGRGASRSAPTECGFVGLLEQANAIDGIHKISFMTSHPKDANEELFKAMARLDRVVKHLHLPIQSGSNRILMSMNRGYTVEKYKKLVKEYREMIPEGKVSTDIIVGFPGETKDDFEETRTLVEKLRFDNAYIFKYSPRPPAKSALLKDDVALEEKKRRNNVILGLQKKISKEKQAHKEVK